jgi:ubiquinone/menaquinone biosynthesis C-methylase UbiE
MANKLPDYAERLDALHRALVDDFRGIVDMLPLTGGERALDAGCGDGFFTGLLAERLATGETIGLDNSPAFLAAAAERLAAPVAAGRVRLVEGDVNALPFDDADLDAVWSGHSMQSYPQIPHVLDEFRRVLRPGGLLAVLETDNIHSIMLSWPPHVELAVRQAEHREIGSEDSYIGTYFPRFAQRLLREAGFDEISRRYVLVHRQHPAGDPLQEYLSLYLGDMLDRLGSQLADEPRRRLRRLADPDSEEFLPRQENFFFGSLQVLLTARAGRTR